MDPIAWTDWKELKIKKMEQYKENIDTTNPYY